MRENFCTKKTKNIYEFAIVNLHAKILEIRNTACSENKVIPIKKMINTKPLIAFFCCCVAWICIYLFTLYFYSRCIFNFFCDYVLVS